MQGKNKCIFDLVCSLDGFMKKIILFKNNISQNNTSHFECCSDLKSKIPACDFRSHEKYIDILKAELEKRFSDFAKIRNLTDVFYKALTCEIENQPVDLQLELCDLQSDGSVIDLRDKIEFWRSINTDTYPKLKSTIFRHLSMFGTSYICESSFSAMNNIKNKKRNSLSDASLENLLRITTSKDENIDVIDELISKNV